MSDEQPSQITDPKALRALTHPVRWKLIELLGLENTATATRCADYTGESVASCSYHLSMLAKYGFVAPAEGGTGREKPWKLISRQQSWTSEGLSVEGAIAANALTDVVVDHEAARIKEASRREDRLPEEWRRAVMTSATVAHVTAEELAELSAAMRELSERYIARRDDPTLRPEGSRPVRLFTATYLPQPPEK